VGRRRTVPVEQLREAQEYLQRYVAASEDRLRWLRALSADTGGPTPDQLDLGRDSLVALWTWALGRFRLRDPGEPLDFVDRGRQGRFYVPRHGRVPMWFGRRGVTAPYGWSDDTLELVDAIVYYFAACLLRANPAARWEAFHAPQLKDHIDESQPVIVGFGEPVELLMPMQNVIGGVFRLINPDEPNPYGIPAATGDDLAEWYDALVGRIGGGG
jgi:hypothetical protein